MRILGVDPGLAITGYGIIEAGKDNQFKLLQAGFIKSSPRQQLPKRLTNIQRSIEDIIQEFAPEYLILEKLYSHYKHHMTAIAMGHARTILGKKSLFEQDRLFKRTMDNNLSVRELEKLVARMNGRDLKVRKTGMRDPNVVSLEEQRQRTLGTKVRIVAGRKRGKILLEYYSLTDLDRLVKLLKRVK